MQRMNAKKQAMQHHAAVEMRDNESVMAFEEYMALAKYQQRTGKNTINNNAAKRLDSIDLEEILQQNISMNKHRFKNSMLQ